MKLIHFASLLAFSIPALAHPNHDKNKENPAPTAPKVTAESAKVYGQNGHQYRVIKDWAKADPAIAPVINSHAIAEGRDGNIYVVTDHPKAAFLVFKKDGTYLRSFGKGLYGGHGIEIFEKDGEEYILHVDCGWHFEAEGWKAKATNGRITMLKTDGTIVKSFPTPLELGIGKPGNKQFLPCDVAVTPRNTILIVDGYASDYVYEMTMDGALVKRWGGPSKGQPNHLANAHGISVDNSDSEKPIVWVSSRNQCALKAFTLDGKYLETLHLPGAYAGQLFIRGDKMYTAVCWSKENGTGKRIAHSGFVLVIDKKTKKVISSIGGNPPVYKDGKLQPMFQTDPIFIHGHDLYVDAQGVIYVGEWNAKRRYPIKLVPTNS